YSAIGSTCVVISTGLTPHRPSDRVFGASCVSFSRYAHSVLGGDPVLSDCPDFRVYRHPLRTASRLTRLERRFRRWQLSVCNRGFTSSVTNSARPSSFATGVES